MTAVLVVVAGDIQHVLGKKECCPPPLAHQLQGLQYVWGSGEANPGADPQGEISPLRSRLEVSGVEAMGVFGMHVYRGKTSQLREQGQ